LIVGLPGEDMESFGAGFDKLIALRPQEIQVGILKRLRGTPIIRHDAEWQMTYAAHPPYEILQTRLIDFATMQRLRRFARYWDLVGNSGNFVETTRLTWSGDASPFKSFLKWSDWLHAKTNRTDSIALARLMELLFTYLTKELNQSQRTVAETLWRDMENAGRKEKPAFLRVFIPDTINDSPRGKRSSQKRQARHFASTESPTL
jgi:hypothetical protein